SGKALRCYGATQQPIPRWRYPLFSIFGRPTRTLFLFGPRSAARRSYWCCSAESRARQIST
ncbi:hypothetical protein MCOR14_010478, partial [Pyricularia oryzae]